MALPPLPPGAVLDDPDEGKKSRKARLPPLPAGAVLDDPQAVDGDTVASGKDRVRLWGIDAPELRQKGYLRDGTPVSIGEDSQRFLQGEIVNTDNVTLGDVAGQSYGRTVGPITLDGRDAGQASIRAGQSLAAPDYLADDPERRAQYVEADRLARQNRLGMHSALVPQTPAEFRANPDYLPDRETVARFWDTPTPFEGLPPDVEAEYQILLQRGTADEINTFLSKHHYQTSRPEDLKAWVKDRDERLAAGKTINPLVSYWTGKLEACRYLSCRTRQQTPTHWSRGRTPRCSYCPRTQQQRQITPCLRAAEHCRLRQRRSDDWSSLLASTSRRIGREG